MPDPAPGERWYYHIWFVLLMLFVVLGPFGLPLVWRNPKMSRRVKIVLTLLTAAFTYLVVIATLKVARTVSEQLRQLQLTLPY